VANTFVITDTIVINVISTTYLQTKRESSVFIAMDYGLKGYGSIHDRGKCYFSSPDRLWRPCGLPGSSFPESEVCEA
jgi:hypothetical protein